MHAIRRAPFRLSFRANSRLYSTPSSSRTRPRFGTTFFLAAALSGGTVSALFGLYTDARSCPTSPFQTLSQPERDPSPPLWTLLRTYFVYGLISCETVVDYAPQLLETLLKVPLVGTVVEGVVRRTFYDHFVGGETSRAALPLLAKLRSENKGALFAYSVEVDEHKAAGNKDRAATQTEQPYKRIVQEMIEIIDVAADFEDAFGTREVAGRRTWVAVKLSALLSNADALRNLSLHLMRTRPVLAPSVPFPGTPESSDLMVLHGRVPDGSPLTAQDVEDLKELYSDLNKICSRAKERNVRIILDAEHSWYQPAIDAFGHALMERFNKLPDRHGVASRFAYEPKNVQGVELQPLVYVTYQAYLRRTPNHLARSLALARKNNYALGVKLVRGAYHPHELAAYTAASSGTPGAIGISTDPCPPVHPTKPDTDACYNECARLLVRTIAEDIKSSAGRAPRIGVLFGTHNWNSSEMILEELVNAGLAFENVAGTVRNHKGTVTISTEVVQRLTFGQLYGMFDSLTNYLVGRIQSATPCVVKYVPYGALAEVMPYISRRAIENKSVLGNGGATRERKEAARLLWKKLFGGIGL